MIVVYGYVDRYCNWDVCVYVGYVDWCVLYDFIYLFCEILGGFVFDIRYSDKEFFVFDLCE